MFNSVTFLLSIALLHPTYFAAFLLIDFNLIIVMLENMVFMKLFLRLTLWCSMEEEYLRTVTI